jgi:hypothetical protein
MCNVARLLIMLLLGSQVALASALDVWGGSNNNVASGSGSVGGANGLTLVDGAAAIAAMLEATASIADGATGTALSDWSIPTTTIARTKLDNGNLHGLSVEMGGHVQTGLQKASKFGEATAYAAISSSAALTPNSVSDSGDATIECDLAMNGKTSGYAIANGVAGFSAAQKQGSTTNDLFKATGSVTGSVDIRGDTTASTDTVLIGGADESSITAERSITTSASAGDAGTASATSTIGVGLSPDYQVGRANTTIAITNANANSAGWDASSVAIKTLDNANALTAINNVNMNDKLITWAQESSPGCGDQDEATTYQLISAISSAATPSATTTLSTEATVARQRAQTASSRQVTSESFINGGSYKAVTRPNELNLLQASGTLGGTYPGVASGAHLWTARASGVLPFDSSETLTQTALSSGTRTTAILQATTDGPAFTGKSNDDAGSYFSTTEFTTLSKSSAALNTLSTSVANPWEINWVNGIEASSSNYYDNFDWTNVGSVPSPTLNTASSITSEPRIDDFSFSLTQS